MRKRTEPTRRRERMRHDPIERIDRALDVATVGMDPRRHTILLITPSVGSVERLPAGYELGTCEECNSPCWVNREFMASCRRRGFSVVVQCVYCTPIN